MIDLRAVRKSFGALDVVHGIDLAINKGEFVVFVGPSGCGKSTLLRMIAGLEDVSDGEIWIGGRDVTDLDPSRRGIAMVFQSYALYPHMSVKDNLGFGLKLARTPADERDTRINRAARMLQIDGLLDRLPRALSGGQRQRVAIGRAITRDPLLFLFDEPLSNLDAALRVATRVEIARLHESLPDTTMIYVTHDQTEAMTLADRIVVLRSGRIEQIGAPMDLYERPANLFVAGFIGSPAMNILPARTGPEQGSLVLADGTTVITDAATGGPGQDASLGIRPEDFHVADGTVPPLLSGRVELVERLGEVTLVHVGLDVGGTVIAKLPGTVAPGRGERLALAARPGKLHVFGSDQRALPPARR
ncbi:MAG: sn-glycerol-3-phosphate ABC transporter ATP-binding protein UgpC [Rubellimicrobium sp.]|nr:sn-glycerol-3-phosphate ABC transporter ATP-binding protein UgpC [Rubellimicrobium sp.]